MWTEKIALQAFKGAFHLHHANNVWQPQLEPDIQLGGTFGKQPNRLPLTAPEEVGL